MNHESVLDMDAQAISCSCGKFESTPGAPDPWPEFRAHVESVEGEVTHVLNGEMDVRQAMLTTPAQMQVTIYGDGSGEIAFRANPSLRWGAPIQLTPMSVT